MTAPSPNSAGYNGKAANPNNMKLEIVRPLQESIPAELRALKQWTVWKAKPSENRPGKLDKDPYQCIASQRKRASHSDPSTWAEFWAAYTVYDSCGYDGVMFAFSPDDPYAGVDLDDCRNPETGEIAAWAQPIIDTFGSYTEVSPSGKGVKIIVRGNLPKGAGVRTGKDEKEGIELYTATRFFCITGHHLPGTPRTIETRQVEVEALYHRITANRKNRDGGLPSYTNGHSPTMSDERVLEKCRAAKNGPKFAALWNGDISGHGNDHSRADMALCGMLAFWTQDPFQIERLFGQSQLDRKKWDRPDYRQRTIQEALSGRTETYSPKGGATVWQANTAPAAKVHPPQSVDEGEQASGNEDEVGQEAVPSTRYGSEILDTAPATISKPLALIGGHAYAATWLHMQVTEPGAAPKSSKAKAGKDDEPPKPTPARVYTTMRPAVIRDDGTLYADGMDYQLSDLEVEMHLPEQPPIDKLWRAAGVRAYTGRGKYRPASADVFDRVRCAVDRFIDFDRSLADQQAMCELIACYIMATWFADAFNVAGNVWPNGERGSGKTQLITIIADLSYLGQVILAGGSYASLRDLADYGAFLGFDDAENLSNPKTSDPDKRALLLAGNRRGNTVPVKEPNGARGWRTRYVNTYCFRGFTAIRMPDPVLASRTIVVPLIRTNNRDKANADPLNYKLWPCDRSQLVDDLWALSLANLRDLPAYDDFVSETARLEGRNLEPWRAVLAVAAWLDKNGVAGLWERMEGLSVKYQDERPSVESTDLTVLLIRALWSIVQRECDNRGISDVSDITSMSWTITAKTTVITDAVKTVASADEADIDDTHITSRRIGRTLGQLRFKKDREAGKGTRLWVFTPGEVAQWSARYGLNLKLEKER